MNRLPRFPKQIARRSAGQQRQNKWMAALKKYNHNKGKWCIPKKGTTEYAKVREIMNNA